MIRGIQGNLPDFGGAVLGGEAPAPLAKLELNRIYRVDIYFYLEGCDPDCLTDRVAMDEALLKLAFFGLLAQ